MSIKDKQFIVAAKLQLLGVPDMSPGMRKQIVEWLINQAKGVALNGDNYTDKWFRATFRFKTRPVKKAKKRG